MNAFPAVLYVEDDPSSREIMQLLLEVQMELTHVNIFGESEDFIARVEAINPKPEIVLLDIHIRPYNGFQMLEMLRQHPAFRNTPVVALTASVMNEEVHRLQQSGFSSVIAKPIDVDTFPLLLTRILDGETIWSVAS